MAKERDILSTKEAAEIWGVTSSWVSSRCREGIIPLSQQENRKWRIDKAADKPPCTGNKAAFVLENIDENSKGTNVKILPSADHTLLEYLTKWGYVSEDKQGMLHLTERGRSLINQNRPNKKTVISKKAKIKGKLKTPVAEIEIVTETTRQY